MPAGCGALPINANVPQTNVRGDEIFVLGGECDGRTIGGHNYTHYPTLALLGKIAVVEEEEGYM